MEEPAGCTGNKRLRSRLRGFQEAVSGRVYGGGWRLIHIDRTRARKSKKYLSIGTLRKDIHILPYKRPAETIIYSQLTIMNAS